MTTDTSKYLTQALFGRLTLEITALWIRRKLMQITNKTMLKNPFPLTTGMINTRSVASSNNLNLRDSMVNLIL